MLNQLDRFSLGLFTGFGLLTILCLWAGFYLEQYVLVTVPFGVLFAWVALTDFKKIFYFLLFLLPLSTEFEVGGGFSTDLPTEPVMVALMAIFLLFIASNRHVIDRQFLTHPLMLLLYLHYAWMMFTAMHAVDVVISLKFLLAKFWYIIVFVFTAAMLLTKQGHFRKFFWLIFIPLLLASIKIFIHHLVVYNLSFEDVNEPMGPFFRNHVNYADMITAFYPFLFVAATWYEKGSWKRWLINGAKIYFVVAVYFSYTRACYLALALIAVAYFIINWKMLRAMVVVGLVGVLSMVGFFISNNNFVELAPVYEKTIHYKEFGDHLQATVKMQDLSSMERVYRWVAAFYMVADNPWVGAGPGNFYPTYKKYAISDFETYVSDNPEHSTVHNYFFLMMTEQGFIGLIVFVLLTLGIFFIAESVYHQMRDGWRKQWIMAFTLSLITLYLNLMLNDMIEVDKTGSFYFMGIAFIISLSIADKRERALEEATA